MNRREQVDWEKAQRPAASPKANRAFEKCEQTLKIGLLETFSQSASAVKAACGSGR